MPNGFHNDPSMDQIYHRHTEHGQPHFRTKRHNYGFVSVHLYHHGGYAYAPQWDTLDLYPFVATRRQRPTRTEMEDLAAELATKLVALQSSNPDSNIRPHGASGLVLLHNWCIVFGDYYVYTRSSSAPFVRIEPPIGSRTDEKMHEAIKMHPELEHAARDTTVHATGGLMFHTPSECVYDLETRDELLASTCPLHEQSGWSQISSLPVDSLESTGRVVLAMRDHATQHGTDHVVIRWRHPARMSKSAAKTDPPKNEIPISSPEMTGGELKVLWGLEDEEIFWLHSYCIIGRSKECGIVLDSLSVSRRHADILWTPKGYVLADLNSTSGIYVNDRRVNQHVLQDGDCIRIGQVVLEFTSGHRTIVDNHLRRHSKGPIVAAMAKHAAQHASGEQALSLVLFDLDHLKKLNDSEGYLAGDAVLAHVESIARAALRTQDTLARIGGEEFAIVLPGMDLQAAYEYADQLRRSVEQSSYVFEGRTIAMTISCGVAQWVGNINRPWALLRQADNRLHEAKSKGRNQVRS